MLSSGAWQRLYGAGPWYFMSLWSIADLGRLRLKGGILLGGPRSVGSDRDGLRILCTACSVIRRYRWTYCVPAGQDADLA